MASRSWNRVELIGNLTRDPELRFTPNGSAVCTFGLATNRTYISEGEKKEEVDFHRLVAWNKLAELCNQLLKKGMRVFISGRLQTRSWESQDGTQRQTTEIVVEDMIILTPKTTNGETPYTSDVNLDEPPKEKPIQSSAKTEQVKEPEGRIEKTKNETDGSEEAEEKEDKTAKEAPKEDVDDLPF